VQASQHIARDADDQLRRQLCTNFVRNEVVKLGIFSLVYLPDNFYEIDVAKILLRLKLRRMGRYFAYCF